MIKNQHGFSTVETLLVIVVIGLIGLVGWLVYDRNNKTSQEQTSNQEQSQADESQSEATPKTLEKGTYGNNGEFGTFQAKGYATIKTEEEPMNICGNTCKEYEIVYFNITEAKNTEANKFKGTPISLGCLESGGIKYYSTSQDGRKIENYSHSEQDTQKITGSTSSNEIILEFNKIEFKGAGSEAPACFTPYITSLVD